MKLLHWIRIEKYKTVLIRIWIEGWNNEVIRFQKLIANDLHNSFTFPILNLISIYVIYFSLIFN